MIIFKTVAGLQHWLDNQRSTGKTIGFVPTMGALHSGHLSLIEESRRRHPVTVCSIFVNPTQFNDTKDFEKYPVTIEQDCRMLEQQQTDIIFLPRVAEMYPNGLTAKKHYDLGKLEGVLDGAFRPGHFQGVCQVVERLLQIVQPTELFLGQKDFQQCLVIKRLVEIMAQQDGAVARPSVNIAPTLREPDGLAMSSRNLRLSQTDRQIAPAIYQQLLQLKENLPKIDFTILKQTAVQNLLNAGFVKVDYVEIADAGNLELANHFDPKTKFVALIAAFVGEVRLIDNMILN
ncbi:MAG: pantoate--beta-alanine ligase [Bacteroidota bacterium]